MKTKIIIVISLLTACFCFTQLHKSLWWGLGVALGCTIAIYYDDGKYKSENWDNWKPGE